MSTQIEFFRRDICTESHSDSKRFNKNSGQINSFLLYNVLIVIFFIL